MQPDRTLREAWLATLETLGAPVNADTLLLGPYAEFLADRLPGPTGDVAPGVATFGVPTVAEGATPNATGFPDGTFDAAVVMSAWETPAGVGPAVAEAVRTVRPGGTVWIGEIDSKALTESMPAARRYGLLYRSDPGVVADVRFRFRAADILGIEAVRAGIREVVESKVDLPVATIASPAEGVEAIRSGMWPGTEVLDVGSLDRLLGRVDASLQPPTRFPVVETLPWLIVRGLRP
jgi:SAM-dependent methyltransferase